MEKVRDLITNKVTGDEDMTQWVIVGFTALCFVTAGYIVYTTMNKESTVPIGPAEAQLLLSEI